jgi:ABC-type polysaccharide/polyol phosphate export permease
VQFQSFWAQTWALTHANLKSRYRNTFAGFIWVVLNPLIMFGAQSYVFSKILKLQVPEYSKFLLSGLLPWIFISQSLDMCTSLFVVSGRLLKSFPLHPLVFLFGQLLDNLINFVAAFLLILIPVAIWAPGKITGLWLLPIPLALLMVGTLSLTWILATCHVFFRDTRFVVSFAMSVLFFLTPVFYPLEFIPEGFRPWVGVNPIYRLIAPFQVAIYDYQFDRLARALGGSALVAFGALGLALALWSRKRNDVYLKL